MDRSILSKIRVWGIRGALNAVRHRIDDLHLAHVLSANARKFPMNPERGITVVGPISAGGSLGKVVRDFSFALGKAEIPFQTFDTIKNPEIPLSDYADILTPPPDFRIQRYSHVVEMFRSPLKDGIVRHRARIGFWEGEHGLMEIFPCLAECDSVIAMSDYNVGTFRNSLPRSIPVFKIPYPLHDIPHGFSSRNETRKRFGIGLNDFVVFYNFDLGSYARKNPEAALKAFAKAFGETPGTAIVFKTKWSGDYPEQIRRLENAAVQLGIRDRLILVNEYLSRNDIYALTNACDIYLSLHRAEGFGIGMVEAMSLGKPVVATNYSASTEFCRPENSIPIPCRMVPIRAGEYFECMREWADADVDAAAAALRRLFESPELRQTLAQKGKDFIASHFSTRQFRDAINNMLDSTTQDDDPKGESA